MDNLAQSSSFLKSKEMKRTAKHTILVIDDSKDYLELQEVLLGMAGYEVLTAETADEALKILSDFSEPDLILLDMYLKEMTGVEFLDILEEKRPETINNVPVVFITGLDSVPKSKAVGFIQKPADMDKLLKDVRHYIEKGHQESLKH